MVRTPTIRGHLRFWWRALHAHRFAGRPRTLYEEEARIWGRAGDENGGGRSQIELRVSVLNRSEIDAGNVRFQDPGAYALWPARRTGQDQPAPRRCPGLEFRLTVSASCADLTQVCDAVRLWILFGGYGSRTRRGLGALTVSGDGRGWLPDGTNEDELVRSLGDLIASCNDSIFRAPTGWTPSTVPVLAGASLLIAFPKRCDGMGAWLAALDRLRDFRQGAPNGDPARSRARGRSYWPEADMVRLLTGRPGVDHRHAPRDEHTLPPKWPRAGFGLPIDIRFAPNDRRDEPRPVQLLWQEGGTIDHNRLASPLIVKPLPVRQGFLPMALWLNRAEPAGQVIAKQGARSISDSAASFSPFRAPLFRPASGKSSLRDAFCDWLVGEHEWRKLS